MTRIVKLVISCGILVFSCACAYRYYLCFFKGLGPPPRQPAIHRLGRALPGQPNPALTN